MTHMHLRRRTIRAYIFRCFRLGLRKGLARVPYAIEAADGLGLRFSLFLVYFAKQFKSLLGRTICCSSGFRFVNTANSTLRILAVEFALQSNVSEKLSLWPNRRMRNALFRVLVCRNVGAGPTCLHTKIFPFGSDSIRL